MSEYPLAMRHPNARKSVITEVLGKDETTGKQFRDYHGTPDVFPPVTVSTADQEAKHRSLGYIAATETVHMTSYQQYPMYMTHPDQPDVLVNSDQERDAYELEGYIVPGTPDPDAAEAAGAAPYDPNFVANEFPKMVDGQVVDPSASSGFQKYPMWIGGQLVNNAAEERALLAATTVPAQGDGKMVDPVTVDRREELRARLAASGVRVDGRWSVSVLEAKLADVS